MRRGVRVCASPTPASPRATSTPRLFSSQPNKMKIESTPLLPSSLHHSLVHGMNLVKGSSCPGALAWTNPFPPGTGAGRGLALTEVASPSAQANDFQMHPPVSECVCLQLKERSCVNTGKLQFLHVPLHRDVASPFPSLLCCTFFPAGL